jgi:SAM-dependent methyltransferase
MKCRICKNSLGNALHYPRELMFGTQEIFEYMECGACGCLQIAAIPENLGAYYPSDYYSFEPPRIKKQHPVISYLRKQRSRHYLGNSALLGKLLALGSRPAEYFGWMRNYGLTLESSILDVGCGNGRMLLKLAREGFSNLLGVDPYIASPIDYGNGVKIIKGDIHTLDRQFDFVMLNHAFEHLPNPVKALTGLRAIVRNSGTLLLRVPVASCYARRKYGIYWGGWDAPRHLFLHTVRSMSLLAQECRFTVERVAYDSTIAQIVISELYLRGIDRPSKAKLALPKAQRLSLQRFAEELNLRGDGDTACFYLRPVS